MANLYKGDKLISALRVYQVGIYEDLTKYSNVTLDDDSDYTLTTNTILYVPDVGTSININLNNFNCVLYSGSETLEYCFYNTDTDGGMTTVYNNTNLDIEFTIVSRNELCMTGIPQNTMLLIEYTASNVWIISKVMVGEI